MPASEPIEWALSGFGDEIDPDPVIQIAVLTALGASHIEVRGAWGVNVVDFDDTHLDRLAPLLKDARMGVSALASPIGKVDVSLPIEHELERLSRAIRVAHALDCRYIRMFSFFRRDGVAVEAIRDDVMERMRALAGMAAEGNVVLLHENEKAIYGDTPERVLDLMQSVASPALRVAWDAANFVQVGVERPFDNGYAMLRPYLEYLQIKDAVAATDAVVPAGHGDGQVRETIAALRDDGYTGFVSLEPHLASAFELGGFSGPSAFGVAARALRAITDDLGVVLR